MTKYIKATEAEIEMVMSSRIEMLKVVNGLPENTSFDNELLDQTREYFSNSDQTTILAVDQEVVGCATICYIKVLPTFSHPSGNRAHIMNVYTRSNYRRRGIALHMMEMLIEEARAKGVTEISLDATDAGRLLYEKCGFTRSEEGMILTL
ncbi:MAG: Acetyltransferase [Firmicutes bacterium]|nr:Acetyltransferase [Bacillota bacterium]